MMVGAMDRKISQDVDVEEPVPESILSLSYEPRACKERKEVRTLLLFLNVIIHDSSYLYFIHICFIVLVDEVVES